MQYLTFFLNRTQVRRNQIHIRLIGEDFFVYKYGL